MSVTGLFGGNLLNYVMQGLQTQGQQIRQDLKKLGSDLSSGNLSAAQSDLTALQQLMPQSSTSASAQSSNNIAQAFNKLSSDLKSGNVSAAQQDYATLQQDMQNLRGHHHHHMHSGGGNTNGVNASTTVSQIFSQLGQELQAGNLSAAQQAYTTLQQDFAQFMSSGGATTASSAASSGLSVTA